MNVPERNAAVIRRFYQAFQEGNAAKMKDCYAADIHFHDPAFGHLKGPKAGAMWEMLLERSKGQLEIKYSDVIGTTDGGSARWEAQYTFGKKKRPVHNKIKAHFVIRNGKIIKHIDHFNFWKWSSMALGLPGLLLGFTPYIRKAVRKNVRQLLDKHMQA